MTACLCLALVWAAAGTASAEDRYVDGTLGADANPGTLVLPWRTIQHAVDQVGPGDTVFVRTGSYPEVVTFEGVADSGSESLGFVTLRSFPGEFPVVDGLTLPPSGRQGLFSLVDVRYVRIEGFEIRDFRTQLSGDTPLGVLVEGASTHIEILGNTIHGIRQENTSDGGANGVGVYGTDASQAVSDLLIAGNEIHDCRLMFSEAFVLNGNVRDFVVRDNVVRDCDNIGFDFIGYEGECASCSGDSGDNVDRARDGVVTGNVASGIDTIDNPAYGGERSAAGFYVDGGANIVFERNVSRDNNIGFELASEHFGRSTDGIVIRNNFISGCDIAGIATGGYSSGNGDGGGEAGGNSIVNNTLYSNTMSDRVEDDWGAEILLQNRNIANTYKNNVVYARSGRPRVLVAGTLNSGNIWGSQLYFGSDAGTTPGVVSLEDPRLVDPANGDLHLLEESPALDLGESLPESLIGQTDFDGDDRVEGTSVDIGADEVPVSSDVELGDGTGGGLGDGDEGLTGTRSSGLWSAPNPFVGETRLQLRLRLSEKMPPSTRVRIIDPAGRTVRELDLTARGPGHYGATWDGCDNRGQPVASGIYLAVAQTGESHVSAKLQLLRK